MHRDQFATCPHCQSGLDPHGDRHTCGPCQGVWLSEPALLAVIVSVVKHDPPVRLAFEPATAELPQTCPRCATTMTAHRLYGVIVERCSEHGVWFDHGELTAALARAANDDLTKAPLGERIGRRWDRFMRYLVLKILHRPWEK